MLRSGNVSQSSLDSYPFVIRMATKHGTKTWFENQAFQRLNPGQLLLAQGATAAELFPFDDQANENIGEVVSIRPLTRTITRRIWMQKIEATVPVLIKDFVSTTHHNDVSPAVCLSFEARRLHSSGGSVALRGILPEDIAVSLSQVMENPRSRRTTFLALLDTNPYAPIITPDFGAIDEKGLGFKAIDLPTRV